MTLDEIMAEAKRNKRVLNEILTSPELRIAYKVGDDWKRLYLPPQVVGDVRDTASRVVAGRLSQLIPAAVDRAVKAVFTRFNE